MGMDAAPGMIIPVSKELVKRVAEAEYLALEQVLEKADSDMDELAQALNMNEVGACISPNGDVEPEEIEETLQCVCNAFKNRTGMSLSLAYIDPEDAGRYDDITGSVFNVPFCEVFKKTSKTKAFEKTFGHELDVSLFTQFG
ncbi:MAG: hypothetical protein AVO34_05200 [Firmicutes bacterium ML8_F2]|jgi:hypothetical protein|nr:MAG: hypothetical protein AVO34_05200 [Firmicutes bacterium ML8_F2]